MKIQRTLWPWEISVDKLDKYLVLLNQLHLHVQQNLLPVLLLHILRLLHRRHLMRSGEIDDPASLQ